MNSETEQIFLLTASTSQPSTASQKILIELPETPQVNLENVEDFSNVCRTCATITEFVIPIFDGEGLQNNLADKIHKHLPIQVSEQDILPRVVCYQCASTLLAWHELVQCSVQAEAALRSRLARASSTPPGPAQEQKSTVLNHNSVTEEDSQSKFDTGAAAPGGPDPPKRDPPALERSCEFCGVSGSEAAYREHLITNHADMLFHCEECDKYISRKDFILHMSLHAVQYSSVRKKDPKVKIVKIEQFLEDDADISQPSQAETPDTQRHNHLKDNEKRQSTQVSEATPNSRNEVIPSLPNNNHENDFSDHSDADYGFGPLPESVFEAIEDSQDSQPIDETTPPHEIETTPKKSHKKTRTCPICAKVYTASSSFFYHMKYFHNKSKEHECKECGRKFGTKASLTQHMPLHTGESQYECKECKKRFRSKASLYIHEQTHNGVKKWSCSQCHKSFRWKTHMLRHMKRHSADKGCVCSVCGRGFKVRCDLLRHRRTHDAGQLACDKCSQKFAQLRYLKAHIEKKHSAGGKEANCVSTQ